jgi:hypothetical protein
MSLRDFEVACTPMMNPASGPATTVEGRVRLEAAHEKFAAACRQVASRDEWMRTTSFGVVPVVDYVRLTAPHSPSR